MHPEVIREEPGQCPICGMDLVKVEMDPVQVPTLATGMRGEFTTRPNTT